MKVFDFYSAIGEQRIELLRRRSWPKGWALFPFFALTGSGGIIKEAFVDFYLCYEYKDGTKYTLSFEDRMADDWEVTEKKEKEKTE